MATGQAGNAVLRGDAGAAARAQRDYLQLVDQHVPERQATRQATQLLETMQAQRLAPDMINDNALISACEKGKQPE